jgi:sugar phosphate isomerase/epimerase
MKLSYQVATPEVRIAPNVTAYQGDLEHSFASVKACGYQGVELMVCNPALVDREKIRRLMEKYALEVPMVCTGEVFGQDGLCFSDTDAARRGAALKRAKDAADLAKWLGAQINIGRLRGGYMWGKNAEDCIANSKAGLREIGEYAKEQGVTVALEPVNALASNFINTTQEGIGVVEEIGNPYFRLMLDTSHMFINDKDMIQSVYEAKGYVTYVHATDSNRLYPGSCKLDFGAFIQALREIGYEGWISVEVFQRPDQDVALQKSYEHLVRLI